MFLSLHELPIAPSPSTPKVPQLRTLTRISLTKLRSFTKSFFPSLPHLSSPRCLLPSPPPVMHDELALPLAKANPSTCTLSHSILSSLKDCFFYHLPSYPSSTFPCPLVLSLSLTKVPMPPPSSKNHPSTHPSIHTQELLDHHYSLL